MASVDILDWRPEVAKYVKGIDTTAYEDLCDDEVKEVCRDFCEFTHLWTLALPRITVNANDNDYTLVIPNTDGDAVIEIIESVQYKENGQDDDQFRPLYPFTDWVKDDSSPQGATFSNPTSAYPGNWRFLEAEVPTHFYVDAFKVLYLFPIPTILSTDGLLVTTVLKPEDSAAEVPLWFWDDWKKAIAWGAAGRILGMTTQKWYNRELGDYFWGRYLDRRSQAALKKTTGFTRRDLKVQIPSFGGSRGKSWVF